MLAIIAEWAVGIDIEPVGPKKAMSEGEKIQAVQIPLVDDNRLLQATIMPKNKITESAMSTPPIHHGKWSLVYDQMDNIIYC